MFGELFGNFEEKQNELKAHLANIIVHAEAGEGAIRVAANANKEITNITIDKEKLTIDDLEQLEDLLMVATNRAIEMAAAKEAEATQKMMQDFLPPGLGGLTNMFGRG